MAYRDLTQQFKQLRSYHVLPLVGSGDEEDQADELHYITRPNENSQGPLDQPEWMHTMNNLRDDMTEIKRKMATLDELHKVHTTPRIGKDLKAEEHEIEILTADIKRLFQSCKKSIESIDTRAFKAEDLLKKNAQSSLANELHNLYKNFRTSQRNYLTKMQTLKERTRELAPIGLDNELSPEEQAQIEQIESKLYDPGFDEAQVNELIANTRDIMRRDKEIREILQSIVELQDLFKEFSALVIEQGTLLDRIDYNLETTQQHIEVANANLDDSIRYTGYSRWTICVILVLVILLGAVALIALRLILKFSGINILKR